MKVMKPVMSVARLPGLKIKVIGQGQAGQIPKPVFFVTGIGVLKLNASY